jgi:hypothetical protein
MMPSGAAATSTQAPLPTLRLDLRQSAAPCLSKRIDMWITLFGHSRKPHPNRNKG